MSLRALAFGPLPKAQVQASQRLSLPSSSGMSGVGSGGGGDYDAALTVGGPLREPEAFNPVFPDLFGTEAQAPATPDFNSETAQTLANPPQGTGVTPPASNLPEAWRTDLDTAFKGLKALQGGVKAVEGPKGQEPDLGSLAGAGGAVDYSAGSPGAQVSGGELGGLEDTTGVAGTGGGGPSVGGGIGALTGLYGLGTAAASGNPIGIAQGAINSYGALTGLAGASPISSAIVSSAPEIAAAIAESAGIATAGMSATQLTAALSGALAAWGGAAAPIIQGIVEYINNAEQMRARDSGLRNNPIKGALYSNATAGVGQANKLFDSLGSDLSGASTEDLLGALTGGTNSVLPYYATAEGGRGAIRASDTVTGRKQGPTSSGVGYTGDGASPAGYTGNFTNAQDKLVAAVNELMRRGATYEELGSLPVSNNWALDSLDASNPLQALYQGNAAKYDAEGQGLLQRSGQYANATPGTLTPQTLFEAAQGAGAQAPDSVTKAGGLITGMYGGPLWAAIARMGAGGPQLQDLIQQHFDPWSTVRGFDQGQLGTALDPILKRMAMEQGTQSQAFTSGGG